MQREEMTFSILNISIIILIFFGLIIFGLIIVNPNKYLDKTRDAQRLEDLISLETAINLYIADGQSLDRVQTGQIYTSKMGSTSFAGDGWLPLDFKNVSSGVPITELPIDPLNNENNFYQVSFNKAHKTFEINGRLENVHNKFKQKTDGGGNDDWFELGTELTLIK